MADEITVSVSLKCVNGDCNFQRRINSVQATQDAIGGRGGVQEIGFAAHEVGGQPTWWPKALSSCAT